MRRENSEMDDHLEIFTTRVWDVGVSRLSGHAVGSIHEKPRGSGDAAWFGPEMSVASLGITEPCSNSH